MQVTEQVRQNILGEAVRLASLSEGEQGLSRILEDEDSSVDAVVEAMEGNPAIAARVLRMSNSVLYTRRGGEVTSLREAVIRIGRATLRNVVYVFILQGHYAIKSPLLQSKLRQSWDRSKKVAGYCSVLSKRVGLNVNEALTTGILHDIGTLALLPAIEENGMLLGSEAAVDRLIEESRFPLGVEICRKWQLPQALTEAMVHQGEGQLRRLVAVDKQPSLGEVLELARWFTESGQVASCGQIYKPKQPCNSCGKKLAPWLAKVGESVCGEFVSDPEVQEQVASVAVSLG